MNNDTSTPTPAFPLTIKEAAPPAFAKIIGGTSFDIHIHFSETSKETFTDKVLRLIQNDNITV